MAIAFRSANSVNGTGTSPTVTEPAGAQSGDVMVAIVVVDSPGGVPGIPAGWTSLYSGASFGTHFRYNIARVVRGGSAPALNWTVTGSVYREVAIVCYSGVDGTTPVDAQAAAVTSVGSTSILPDPPAVTSITTGAMAVCIMAFWGTAPAGGWTAPTNHTIRLTVAAASFGFSERLLAAPATENPVAFGGAPGGTDDGISTTIALRPSSGAAVTVKQARMPQAAVYRSVR
jgi:hypothetical protein